MKSSPRVALVGGGFSGTMVLANLVAEAEAPFSIDWYEASPPMGRGAAYGTQDPAHLLNVPASRMGALAGHPGHFWQWLQTGEGKRRAQHIWPQPDENGFAPRMLYAAYLGRILEATLEEAAHKGIEIRMHTQEVIDATSELQLSIEGDDAPPPFNALVLATGNLPSRRFGFEETLGERYIRDSWRGDSTATGDHVVIIGSGLTAVDNVLSLKQQGYRGTITLLSRHGWIPAAHGAYAPYRLEVDPAQAPQSILAIYRALRAEIAHAQAKGHDWRSVIDALRPVTQTLWRQLPAAEKKRFFRQLFTLWNIHRHRMAPQIHAQLTAWQADGTLRLIAGKVLDAGPSANGIAIRYAPRGEEAHTLEASLLINCTGPQYTVASSAHRLLHQMSRRRLLPADALGMGINGAALPPNIFAIGSLRVGELLECTAVPELREQAQAVAQQVLQRIA